MTDLGCQAWAELIVENMQSQWRKELLNAAW